MVTGGKVLKLEVELKRFRGGHCTSPAQPTPLSALLGRPGLQLLYCLIQPEWRGEVVEEGGYGAVYTSTPHALSHPHTV